MATKKSVNMNDYKTEDIDKMFEKAPKGMVFTGTGYNPGKKKTTSTTTKKKVKRSK